MDKNKLINENKLLYQKLIDKQIQKKNTQYQIKQMLQIIQILKKTC